MKNMRTVLALFLAVLLTMSRACADEARISSVCNAFDPHGTPSTGRVGLAVFLVDFPDQKYASDRLSEAEIESLLFGEGENSMTAFEENASYGLLQIWGTVCAYTAKEPFEAYKNTQNGYEKLAEEVLLAFDDTMDYAQFDSDGNGYLDAFALTVAGADDYWYGCTATWCFDTDFELDGVRFDKYIINDAQPYRGNEDYFVQEILHEFGHCMGLPDYYPYDANPDYEALHGEAGIEPMDDMEGDFSQFSKLMLGWLSEDQVQVFQDAKTQYTLRSAQIFGDALIIPKDSLDDKPWTGEFFLIEYDTPEGNMASALTEGGVRIFHIDAETIVDESGIGSFRYNGYSPDYDPSPDGRRIIRLVNDAGGYFQDGAVIDASTDGFAWYGDANPQLQIALTFSEDGESVRCTILPTA